MKTYRVDIEFTSPAYVVADTEEDAIAEAFDRLLYETDITAVSEMSDDEDYMDNYEDNEWIE